MADLRFENVADELHEELRRRATAAGTTVSAYVIELIRRDLERSSARDWLARLDQLERVQSERPMRDLVREGRATRPSRGGAA